MKKTNQNRLRAMAIMAVAMLAVCSLSVCMTDGGSDAAYSETFSIPMASGSKFTYTPTFNLTQGTITVSSSGTAKSQGIITQTGTSGLNNGTTLTGTFNNGSANGTSTSLTIEAVWRSADTSLSQTATQTINFTTYTKVSLPTALTSGKFYLIQGDYNAADKEVAKITATGPSKVTTSGNFSSGPFTASHANGVVTIKTARALTSSDVGSHSITVTADDGNSGYVDQATQTYTFTVYRDLTVTASATVTENYIGNTANTSTVTFSVGNQPSNTTVSFAGSCDFGTTGIKGSMNPSTGVYTIDISGATRASVFTGSNANADVVSFTINASATVTYPNNAGTKTIPGSSVFRIYKDLAFQSTPTVSNSVQTVSNSNPLDLVLTAEFEGASRITYTWGDGTSTTVEDGPETGSTFSVRHVYEKPGTYVIVTTAYNSAGMMSTYTMYDAEGDDLGTTGGEEDVEPTSEKGFFDRHGYQFIVFMVLFAAMVVAILFYGYENTLTVSIAVIAAILTVLCFIYKDIGSAVEHIRTLLKL